MTNIMIYERPLRGAIRTPPPGKLCRGTRPPQKGFLLKVFTFTTVTRCPKGNGPFLLVLELEGIKDSRDAKKPKVCI